MTKPDFQSFMDRAFWALCIGVVSFGVKFLGDLSAAKNADELKHQVEEQRLQRHDELLADIVDRIRRLEGDRLRGDLAVPRVPRRP